MIKDNSETLQSQTIDWLRFPLIICVVFIHNWGYGGVPSDLDYIWQHLNANDAYTLMRVTLSGVFPHIAVPAFFLISGYLFFYKWQAWDSKVYKRKIKSRIKTLLIPYIIWNSLQILSIVYGDALYNISLWLFRGVPLSFSPNFDRVSDFVRAFWDVNSSESSSGANIFGIVPISTSPINVPLWYVRELMVNVALAPLFFWCIKHIGKYYIGILLLMYLTGFTFNVPGLSISSLLFFNAGAYFSINGRNMLIEFKRIEKISYILAGLFLIVAIATYSHKISVISPDKPYIVFGVISAFCLASRIVSSQHFKMSRFLTSSVFFVYAAHTLSVVHDYDRFILPQIYGIGYRWVFPIAYISTPIVKVIFCLVLYYLLQLSVPRILSVMVGSRSTAMRVKPKDSSEN